MTFPILEEKFKLIRCNTKCDTISQVTVTLHTWALLLEVLKQYWEIKDSSWRIERQKTVSHEQKLTLLTKN